MFTDPLSGRLAYVRRSKQTRERRSTSAVPIILKVYVMFLYLSKVVKWGEFLKIKFAINFKKNWTLSPFHLSHYPSVYSFLRGRSGG